MICITVHYTGHVQGVGFRYAAIQIAGGHAVAGYVQNLPEGRVKLVAEGRPAAVHGFLAEVHSRLSQYIEQAIETQTPGTGALGDPASPGAFTLRH